MVTLLAGASCVAALAFGSRLGHAEPTAMFTAGETLSAAKMNGAFSALEARIAELEKQRSSQPGTGVPPGTIIAFGGSSVPDGWVLCDGSSISRAQQAGLFAAIGTGWGAGDGATTFNVPDLRGRFLRGVDLGAGRDPDRAARTADKPGGHAGDLVGSIQGDALRTHVHDIFRSPSQLLNIQPGGSPVNGITGESLVPSGLPRADPPVALSTETRPANASVTYIIKL